MPNAIHHNPRQHHASAPFLNQVEPRSSPTIASDPVRANVTSAGPVFRRLPASLPMRFVLTRRIRRPACRG